MRKGFDGLAMLVQEQLKRDPHDGQLFAFRGRRGDLIKPIWHDGQGMCLTIGKHGTWTVDQARREARAILGEIARGQDPATRRDVENRTPTMDALADRFLDEEIAPKRAPATTVLYRDLWNRLGKADLGGFKITEVSFRDIAELHYRLRGTPITANRLVAVLSSMFSWCERQGLKRFGASSWSKPPPGAGSNANWISCRSENEGQNFLSGL